ncbi:MAG: DsrE family protein [Thermoplasmata archaeon]|nr:DsrE family protein [Thermoplasmata archaeon]MCJ7562704.1 DsrE family protein [Thermoplasmata archaeon]
MTKTLTIIWRTGSMMAMDANIAIKLAGAARAKGYKVNMFGYGEGVTAVKKGQNPKRFPSVGNDLEAAGKNGVTQAICETCFAARGFERGEEIPSAKVGSLTNDLFKFLSESDRLVTIAR